MRRFRKVCLFLHREIGYFAVGLTLVYAISGVAVNHIDDWNPSYALTTETYRIEPIELPPDAGPDAAQAAVLERLGLQEPIRNVWRPAPGRVQVFLESGTIEVELATGQVERSTFRERPFLYDLNFLHLNAGKGIWTIAADVYAGMLAVLALTGPFLFKGRKGLAGRGGVWLALGVVLPILYLVFQRYL